MNTLPDYLQASGLAYRPLADSGEKALTSPGNWRGRGVSIEPLLAPGLSDLSFVDGNEVSRGLGRKYGSYVQKKLSRGVKGKSLSQRRIRKLEKEAHALLHSIKKKNVKRIDQWLKEGLVKTTFEHVTKKYWGELQPHEKRHLMEAVRVELSQSRGKLDLDKATILTAMSLERHRSLYSYSAPESTAFLLAGGVKPPVMPGQLREWGEQRYSEEAKPGDAFVDESGEKRGTYISRRDLALVRNTEYYTNKVAELLSGSPVEKLEQKSYAEQRLEARELGRSLVKTISDLSRRTDGLPPELAKAMVEDLRTQIYAVADYANQLGFAEKNDPLRRSHWQDFKEGELASAVHAAEHEIQRLEIKMTKGALNESDKDRLASARVLKMSFERHLTRVEEGQDRDLPPVSNRWRSRTGGSPSTDPGEYTKAILDKFREAGFGKKEAFKKLKQARMDVLYDSDWPELKKTLEVRIDGQRRRFDSRITPAGQIRWQGGQEDIFPTHYQGKGVPSSAKKEGIHAVNLAETELSCQKEEGQRALYKGLRSGTLCAYGISKKEEREKASQNRVRELVTAALKMKLEENPDLLKQSGAIDLKMVSTSLLSPDQFRHLTHIHDDELKMQQEQMEAFRAIQEELNSGKPLVIVDGQGQAHEVPVKLDVAMMNYGVNNIALSPLMKKFMRPWGTGDRVNPQGLSQLMGGAAPGSEEGGWAKDYLQGSASEHDKEIVRTLIEQIRDLHTTGDYKKEGEDAYKMVERIQLLAHKMGAVPHFNCKSGKDRTGEADAYTKRLAAEIDQLGYVPDPRQPVGQEERVLSQAFLFNTGNLEMQQKNINKPGYKTQVGKKRVGDFAYRLSHKPKFNRY